MRGYGQLKDFTGSAGLSLSYTDSSTLLLSKEPAPEGAAKKTQDTQLSATWVLKKAGNIQEMSQNESKHTLVLQFESPTPDQTPEHLKLERV